MGKNISVDEFVATISEYAQKYGKEVVDEINDGLERIGREAVQEVKALSPVYAGDHVRNVKKYGEKVTSGAYKRRWTFTVDSQRGKITVTVYNRQWSLTHLLENGHLNRDGTTRSRAIPHISIANQHAEEKVDKLLEGL